MYDRVDTEDDGAGFRVSVLVTTAKDVRADAIDIHANQNNAVMEALLMFDLENDSTGKFLSFEDRKAARERFKKKLLSGDPVSVGNARLQMVTRYVKP